MPLTLKLRCRYQNTVVQPGTAGSLCVKLEVQDNQKRTAAGFTITPNTIDLPLGEGSVRFGPVLVQSDTTATEGSYSLSISAKGLPRIRTLFELYEAQRLTTDVAEALDAYNQAIARRQALKDKKTGAGLRDKKHEWDQRKKALLDAEETVQQCVPSDASGGTLQEKLERCDRDLAALPSARSAREHPTAKHPLHEQLMAVPGVLGFLHDLVFVRDDNDARVLSWMAQRRLQTLVVDTFESSKAVSTTCPAFKGRMLPLDIADRLQLLHLPHTGNFLALCTWRL